MRPPVTADKRGFFVKTFHAEYFERLGLRSDWREDYYTSSRSGVLRGMHFQVPPAHHAKVVFCLAGQVLDVVIDLRIGSPTFGISKSFVLRSDEYRGVYVPSGCAHGFLSQADHSILYYKVTSVHSPAEDQGIHWSSFGFDWGVDEPSISTRDATLPALDAFMSPFRFDPKAPAT